MVFDPSRFVQKFRCLMVVTVATAAIASAGCGGDNPSNLAGTIDPQPRPSKTPSAKAPSPDKVNETNGQR